MNKTIPKLSIVLFLLLTSLLLPGSPFYKTQHIYHLEDPVKFIQKEFRAHDIILLGEAHNIRENLQFLEDLIPALHQHGINILFYEFANYADSARINQLINSKHFDEDLAKDIIQSVYTDWNYREYSGVFRAAWRINQNCRKIENRFKIIGLNSCKWSEAPPIWTEENWAECIMRDAVDKLKKALVYCGSQHSLTKFEVPFAEDGKFSRMSKNLRVGQILYKRTEEKCITIWLHQMWPDKYNHYGLLPCQGFIDSLISSLPANRQQFAFDTKNSRLGQLKDSLSIYSLGYNPVRLNQIVDGYIVLKPATKLTLITESSHNN